MLLEGELVPVLPVPIRAAGLCQGAELPEQVTSTQNSFELLLLREQRGKRLLNLSYKHYTVGRISKSIECHPLM